MNKIFADPTAAREYLESLLWPNGPVCPHCASERATKLKGKSTRPGVYWCNDCQKPFSVTVGTVYERSHIPLNKWLYATHLMMSSKKGISAHQLMRMLEIKSYRSAWFMAHRIREGIAPVAGAEPPLGGEGKVVEADETYIGKKDGKRKAQGAGGYAHKRTVLSLVERGGKIRSFKIGSSKREHVGPVLHGNIDPATTLHTDGANVYKFTGFPHEAVDHNSEYVREGKSGKVHTNTLEGFFSVFKRGMVGTYQHCGEQHLQRYLNEFDFRMNYRSALGYEDAARTEIALTKIKGKRLTYRRTDAV